MAIESITVPTDAVTLHRWDPDTESLHALPSDGRAGQIGEPIPVSRPGTVCFPAYVGEPTSAYIVAWYQGQAMYYHEVGKREWPYRPVRVRDGDVVSIQMPVTATLSSV